MTKKYKYTADQVDKFSKHGIDLTVYNEGVKEANVVHVQVEEGHFQEFYDVESTFIYYIIQGKGIFYLDDKKVEVKATDLVVIPPKTKIYYFGKMEMVLTVAPAFDPDNERHVRFIDKKESPFYHSEDE
jgi:mannose-6-phosphate isomerase-like protein (cupin superfamily)